MTSTLTSGALTSSTPILCPTATPPIVVLECRGAGLPKVTSRAAMTAATAQPLRAVEAEGVGLGSTVLVFGEPGVPWAVEWPVVRTTAAALCLRTPGGDLWVSKERWSHLPRGFDEVLAFLASVGATQDEALVSVSRLGPGSRPSNCRVEYCVDRADASGAPDGMVRRRSAIVAISLLTEGDGQQWVPRWCLAKNLRRPDERFAFTRWTGNVAVRAQLEQSLGGAGIHPDTRSKPDHCWGPATARTMPVWRPSGARLAADCRLSRQRRAG